jgi:hypothetical protein
MSGGVVNNLLMKQSVMLEDKTQSVSKAENCSYSLDGSIQFSF